MSFTPDEIRRLQLRRDDVVVVEGGAGYGRSAVLSQPLNGWGFQNSINRVRVHDGDGRFLNYCLLAAQASGYFAALINTATIPHLTAEKLAGVRIAWPVAEEQAVIADYLDTQTSKIDALIGKQERLIETLAERRQSVIDGHFGPSRSNRPIRLRKLLVARPTYGVLVPTYVDGDDAVPFVRVGDLATLDVVSPSARISEAQSTEYSRTRVAGGEVLLGVVGRMGQVAIVPERLNGANVARAIAVLRCGDRATSELLAIWLTSTMFLNQAGLSTSGDSVQPTLGMGDLAAFGMQWPMDAQTTEGALHDLRHQILLIDGLRKKTERFIELSKERRAALITAAVTGKIDVRSLV